MAQPVASPTPSTRTIKTLTLPFGNDIMFAIVQDKSTENIIVSPVGVQAAMALVCLGAHGETSTELENHLKLGGSSKIGLMEQFGEFLAIDSRGAEAKIKMANRLYLDKKYKITKSFQEQAEKYFDSDAVNINLANVSETVKKINVWVESRTEEKVQGLISSADFQKGTSALLVNAVYLKAKWATIFDSTKTTKKEFFVNDKKTIMVNMMYQKDQFIFGYVKELDAHVIELNFTETNISMIVVLPKVRGALAPLETKLKKFDITKLTKDLKKEKVHLYMPRFQIQFEISLRPILEKLGMRKIFTKEAQLSTLLADNESLAIGLVKQKTLLEIHELGTDPNAKSSMHVAKDEGNASELVINHPFFFVVRDHQNIYFAGHIVNI